MAQWEVEVWQGENGRWRWTLYKDDEIVDTSAKSEKTQPEAVEAAKALRRRLQDEPKRSRIVLDE